MPKDSVKEKFGMTRLPRNVDTNKRLNELGETEARMRGWFLMGAIGVENMLGGIISCHFCPDDLEDQLFLYSLVIAETSFRRKHSMVRNLLKLQYPELWKKYSKTLNQVDKMIDRRNDLAHASYGPSDAYVKSRKTDRIQLRFFREGELKTKEVLILDFNKWLEEGSRVLGALGEIEKSVRERRSRKSSSPISDPS